MAKRQGTPRRSAKRATGRAAKQVDSKPRKTQAAAKATVAKRPVKVKAKAVAKKPARRRGIGALTPYLTVVDVAASLAFYAHAFGFKPGVTMSTPEGRMIHAVMHYRGAVAIMFSPEGIWSGTMQAPVHSGAENPITMYVRCLKVDALTDRARASGATILTEPADMFWGDRMARIADPDGYVWCFATRVGKFDPSRIPRVAEPSAEADLDIQF